MEHVAELAHSKAQTAPKRAKTWTHIEMYNPVSIEQRFAMTPETGLTSVGCANAQEDGHPARATLGTMRARPSEAPGRRPAQPPPEALRWPERHESASQVLRYPS